MRYRELAKNLLIEKKKKLNEKLILYNEGADYGQVVFLAGGTGSGKGFAIKNFIQGKKFKILDVDKWKEIYSNLKNKFEKHPSLKDDYPELLDKYPGLEKLDLQNPEDVTKLHKFVKKRGIHSKSLQNLFKQKKKGRLPNLIFDVTLKNISKITDILPKLKEVGYESDDIHITWVLTDYEISIKRNRNRERIVPDDIVLKTHEGAAETMISIIESGLPIGVDGSVRVILNNPETTIFWKKGGEPVRSIGKEKEKGDTYIIEDFKYLTLKEAGEPFKSDKKIKRELFKWIKNNIPKTVDLWKLMRKEKN